MWKFWCVYLCYCLQQSLSCDGYEGGSNSPCLTTTKNNDYVNLTCTVNVLHSKITFLDPMDNVAAFCTLPISTLSCKSNVRAGRIFQDLEKKTTIFRLPTANLKEIDGVWKCIHGNDKTELLIEMSAGIVNYVSVNLEAYVGNFVHENQNKYLIIIKCETCWTPVGNTAAFYINSVTKDEVRRSKGKCYHRGGECTADTCGCSVLGYEYTWKFYIKNLIKDTNISCSMRFEDTQNHFSKEATVSYDGTGFTNHREKINIIRDEIKEQNLTTTDKNMTDKPDDNSAYFAVAVVVVIVLAAVVICLIAILCIHYRKRSEFKKVPTTDNQTMNEEKDELIIRLPVEKSCPIKQKDEALNINESTNAGFNICKACNNLTPNKKCVGCPHFFCEICSDHHRNCNGCKPLVIRQPTFKRSFSRYDGPRHELKFKRTVHVADPTVRIRGVALLPDGRIVIADCTNRELHVFNLDGKVDFRKELLKEPRGLVRIYENNIAVTFAYEKEIFLFSIKSYNAVNYKIFDLKDIGKPFSIDYNNEHFLVEVGEREDGKLVIFDKDAVERFVIPNNKYAHFTGNSIDLGLNMEQEEVYLSSINNKAVYCFSLNGETKWVVSVPIPQGVTAIRNSSSESRIILVTNKNGPHTLYEMCSSDGRTHMMECKDSILSPRYITSTTIDGSMFLCVEVEKRYLKVYEITEITEIIENDLDNQV